MMRWAPGRPGDAAGDPSEVGTAHRLETIGRILDESRDLLDTALERGTSVEAALRRAEHETRDLQWDAAKILLDRDPSRPAVRAVQAGGDQLVTDLRHLQARAEDLHDTLRQAGRHLAPAAPLVTELTGATRDPGQAVAAAMLATRLERLNTLVELATPLAERTSTRIEQAHQTLTDGLKQTADLSPGPYPNPDFHRGEPIGQPGTVEVGGRVLAAVRSEDGRTWCPAGDSGDWFALSTRLSTDTYLAESNPLNEAGDTGSHSLSRETFHQFWTLDRGILDTARGISDARTSATHGAELTELAVANTTVTAAHTRDLQRRHTPHQPGGYPYPATPARPGRTTGPVGPAI